MAAPPSSAVSPIVTLIVRLLTAVLLLITMILVVTNTVTQSIDFVEYKLSFTDFYVYRYILATAVIGLVYTLMQATLNILLVSTGNRVGGESMLQFDFFADKVISYFLATGAAAAFGYTIDAKQGSDTFITFVHKAEAAASICLLAFLLSAVSSIFSSFSLPKRV